MKWYPNLYLGTSLQGQGKYFIRKRLRMKLKRSYVITFPSNPTNLMDIISTAELCKKNYPKSDLYIMGIAGDYEEAVELAGCILSETYYQTGTFHLKKYLESKTGRKVDSEWES
ncbi:MAG: hypothetical protein ACK5ML_02045 [Lachnospiraceae bacterium]